MTVRSITVRLPEPLYQESLKTAKARNVSMNALLQLGLAHLVREREEQELYDEFTLAGEDPAENDLEYSIAAQAEVMLGDE